MVAEAVDEANSNNNGDVGSCSQGPLQNRRDQKGKLRYPKFLRIWNFYIEEPKLKVDIWGWQPKTV